MTLNFNQEAREADFRYGLVRVRENAESIAFYDGDQDERALLKLVRRDGGRGAEAQNAGGRTCCGKGAVASRPKALHRYTVPMSSTRHPGPPRSQAQTPPMLLPKPP